MAIFKKSQVFLNYFIFSLTNAKECIILYVEIKGNNTMTQEQATKKVNKIVKQLNPESISEETITTAIKMYTNNPKMKSSKLNKNVKSFIERNANLGSVKKWEGLTLAEINRMDAEENLPSSMRK